MQEESDFLRGQMTALYDQIEKLKSENESLDDKLQEQMCLVGSLLEENAKLIAERDRYKMIALSTMRQKAVGEVTEDNGVLGAVFYAGTEMTCGETIYSLPVSALALQERIDQLLAERDDALGRKRADELAENGDMYADVYCQIVDLIDPHVKRGPKDNGELPASVVHSVEFLFEFWIKHKAERERWMKLVKK